MAVPSVSLSSSSLLTGSRRPTAGQPIADNFPRYCGAQQFQLGRRKVDGIERLPFASSISDETRAGADDIRRSDEAR
jgi:hypothetical protein